MTFHASFDPFVCLLPRLAYQLAREKNSEEHAIRTTITSPPANSASANCHPISTMRMMLSSATKFVEAISNAIAAVKSAPFRKWSVPARQPRRNRTMRRRRVRCQWRDFSANRPATACSSLLLKRPPALHPTVRIPKSTATKFPEHGKRHPESVSESSDCVGHHSAFFFDEIKPTRQTNSVGNSCLDGPK